MKVAICDNDDVSIDMLSDFVKKTEQIKQFSVYKNPEILIEEINRGNFFDIVFMDIDLGVSNNGIDFASKIFQISPNIQIIFVTGHNDKYSQSIFLKPVNLCGFLVKPFDIEIYNQIIIKAMEHKEKQKEELFWYKFRGNIQSVSLGLIQFFESRGHQVYIDLGDEVIVCYEKLDLIKQKLPSNFVQCHKSYIVNMDYIKRIEQKQICCICDKSVPISKSKYLDTRNAYFRYIGETM